jgi:putative SOS response-associated peptidase YedK
MCGRFALVTDPDHIKKYFNIRDILCEYRPDWNIMPGRLIPAIINDDGVNKLVCFCWGLIPSWSKNQPAGNGLINARAETLDEKPSFHEAFKKRRCLIVADGFYEWKREGGKKTPLYYYLKSGRPFALAGLYETWMSPDKKEIRTCAIITTGANELIARVHDRMPAILTGAKENIWLQGNQADIPELKRVLQPYPADQMDCKPGMGPHDLFFEK